MMRAQWLILIVVVAVAVSVPILFASATLLGANKTVETDALQKLGYSRFNPDIFILQTYTLKDSKEIPQMQTVWADNYAQFVQYVEAFKPATIYDVPANVDWLAPFDGHGGFSFPPKIPQNMREALYFVEGGTVYVYQ